VEAEKLKSKRFCGYNANTQMLEQEDVLQAKYVAC